MRVTEKGQVTIPKPIRDRPGIGLGSEVEFVETADIVQLRRLDPEDDPVARRQEFERWVESARGTIDTMGMDGKEYVDWLRGPREDLDPGLMRTFGSMFSGQNRSSTNRPTC